MSDDNAMLEMLRAENKRIWAKFDEGKLEEAIFGARRLLTIPACGKAFQASAHIILAHSDDCQVEHSEIAINLIKTMYKGREHTITQEQKDYQALMLQQAEEVREQAQKVEDERLPADEAYWNAIWDKEAEEEAKLDAEEERVLAEAEANLRDKGKKVVTKQDDADE